MFIVNIPFGYWRGNLRKFRLKWFLSIHVPIIFDIILRKSLGLDLTLKTFVLVLIFFLAGQFLGGKLYKWRKKNNKTPLTYNLLYDIAKDISNFYNKSS